jgi:hypothetical protein
VALESRHLPILPTKHCTKKRKVYECMNEWIGTHARKAQRWRSSWLTSVLAYPSSWSVNWFRFAKSKENTILGSPVEDWW